MRTAPYGSWKSPITSDLIVSRTVGLSSPSVDGDDIYWLESRPNEGGRSVLVRLDSGGTKHDVTPAPFNVRTRVHEYGGGAWVVDRGTALFCNFQDQRLYRVGKSQADPSPVTPALQVRFADGVFDRRRNLTIWVMEDHSGGGDAVNSIGAISSGGDGQPVEPVVLVSGNDFYSYPRLSPDGSRLCWTTWNHHPMNYCC